MTTLIRWQINRGAHSSPGFFVPLPWVEAAWGRLPSQAIKVERVSTILADWVDCGGRVRNTTDYFLGAGDWAPIIRSTDGDPVREEARQLQAADLVYTDTAIYQALLGAALAGDPQRRQGRMLYAREDIDAYFERFVRLFRSIQSHGVLPHATLDAAGLRFNQDRGLGVAVDADGRLHRLQGGNHRWAIARVLGLSEVPVELRLHHVRSGLVIDD